MSNPIITAEGIGKKYILTHQQKQPYYALRDVIAGKFKAAGRSIRHPFTSDRSSFTDPSHEEFWALKDVSFEVNEGDRIGIIGRNGAGKSTLLKVLSRITEPTEGVVRLRGRLASLLEVGTGFHPELTGRENIYLNGAILGMSKSEITRKFDEIVAFAETEKFLDTPVKRYSSGMYVRLAFAVAAHLEPEILLVDEVLAVGDAEFQNKCLGKMEDVAKEGRTILFVSHNMLAIKNLCSSALVLKQGQTEFLGDVSTAVDHYLKDKTEIGGEVVWDSPESAPGNHQVRLKAVRILSDGVVTGEPRINREIEIQVDYWNLEKDSRRIVVIHVFNTLGIMLFSSVNWNMCSLVPDPWVKKKYPVGLFRTSCTIPASLLNNGIHRIDAYICGVGGQDIIIAAKNILSFDAQETDEDRTEYLGEWLGAIRPKLLWQTHQLE